MFTLPVIESVHYIIHKISNNNFSKSLNFFVHLKNMVIPDINPHSSFYSIIWQMNHFGKLSGVENIRTALLIPSHIAKFWS